MLLRQLRRHYISRGDTQTSADLALTQGNILTMNPKQPHAEAVAIKDGRILKVGSNREVKEFIGKNTNVINLKGKTVLPGLIDTHIHVLDFARFLLWEDLSQTQSISDMQALLRERVGKSAKGKWIVGRGWDEKRFSEKRLPVRWDLDTVSRDNPVLFYHGSGQIALASSKALQIAGITSKTAVPSGGTIDKDAETGEPTGILRESATDLVWQCVPEPTAEELAETAEIAVQKILAAGITGIHWLATSEADLPVLQRLVKARKLPLRVYMVIPASLAEDFSDGKRKAEFENDLVRIGGAEIYADGFLSSKTAALEEPYSDDGSKASLACTQQELNAQAAKIRNAGLQLIIHAMGDKAINSALTAIEASSGKGELPRLDEAAVLSQDIVHGFQRQNLVVSVQPCVMASEFSIYSAVARLGEKRARWLYPLKTLFKEGIRVSGGSDCPMEPLNPMLGIEAAVTGHNLPEEHLTVDEALQMYTVNAAYASGEESVKGSIEEGKLADLAVLSGNPQKTAATRIHEIKTEMTIVNGKIQYNTAGWKPLKQQRHTK